MESHIKTDILGQTWGLYANPTSPQDVATVLDAMGFKSWVNVNTAPLADDVKALLDARHVTYHHYPIEVPVNSTAKSGHDVHKIIKSTPGPVAIQCATSNRASAALAIHYGISQGLDSKATLAWATSVGLKCMGTPALRTWITLATGPLPAAEVMGTGKQSGIIFRQLFEKTSSTYTYLLACPGTLEAVLIDPVLETAGRDLELVNALGLKLVLALNTHVHADHVSGTAALKAKVPGLKSVIAKVSGAACDVAVSEGDRVSFGARTLRVLSTPGHTDGCITYVLETGAGEVPLAFTGDTLFVRGCGRTDFQQGSSERLWSSLHDKIFRLPRETILYPGHDYNGHLCTTVAEEQALNPRLGLGRTLEEFKGIMAGLNLPAPAQLDRAVPANMKDGVEEPKPAAA